MNLKELNKKGLWSFLGITFALTLLVTIMMAVGGMEIMGSANVMAGQMIIAGMMFAPALATVIVRQFITKEGWQDAGLKWGDFKHYFKIWWTIPVLFFIIYGITAIFYQPDFSMTTFAVQSGITELPEHPGLMLWGIFIITLVITPFVNSVAGFGEELGWRGYLLPKLMPLGTKRALIVQGIIWGLWHVPLVLLLGFGGYGNNWLGALIFLLLITLLGVYFGYLRLQSGSTVVVAWAHGVFNSQSYGIWVVIFPEVNKYIGGITGLFSILVFGFLAWYIFKLLDKKPIINL